MTLGIVEPFSFTTLIILCSYEFFSLCPIKSPPLNFECFLFFISTEITQFISQKGFLHPPSCYWSPPPPICSI